MATWSAGERHGWLAEFCPRLEIMLHGRDAAAVNGKAGELAAAVVLLPMWRWGTSVIDVGRKDRAADGGQLLMPIRMMWSLDGHDTSSVQVLDEGIHHFSWRTIGLGVTMRGDMDVTVTGRPGDLMRVECGDGVPPQTLAVGLAHNPRFLLEQLSVAGAEAKFRMLADKSDDDGSDLTGGLSLAPWVDREIHQAHLHLAKSAAEAAGLDPSIDPPALMGEAGYQECRNAMLFGKPRTHALRPGSHPSWDERDISPRVPAMLDRCLDAPFDRYDPLIHTSMSLHRDAQDTVKRYVGDCPEGVRIRTVASNAGLIVKDVGDDLIAEVLTLFRQRHPNVGSSYEHVRAALLLANNQRQHAHRPTRSLESWMVDRASFQG